jgi:hypothetical protein
VWSCRSSTVWRVALELVRVHWMEAIAKDVEIQILRHTRRIVVVQGDGDPAVVVAMRGATNWLRFTPAAFLLSHSRVVRH